MSQTFFVAGITGKVGGATAQHLLDAGHAVRALVRDPEKALTWQEKGVEVRQGDLTEADALADALEGVAGAFVMQPTPMAVSPDFPEARALVASFENALRQTPALPRLVVLSSVGSQQTRGLGNITQTHLLEEALNALPFPTAFVRAGGFLENNLPALERAAGTGFFDSFLQPVDRAFPLVATADIGAEVARLLTGSVWNGKKIIELGSPVTPSDLARAMGEVLNKPVEARPIPRAAWDQVLATMGLPPEKTKMWEEMQDGFNSGWIAFGVAGTEPVPGTTTPAEVFAQAQKARQNR